MKKKLVIAVFAALLAIFVLGCKCEHEWVEADCLTPKTCSKCEETEGEALGHDWIAATCKEPETCDRCGETQGDVTDHNWQAATCEAPETCELCGDTKGEALGHTWQDATCTAPKTCSVCNGTEGEALGHTAGEKQIEADIEAMTATETVNCDVCGEQISSENIILTSFIAGDQFIFTPDQYTQLLQAAVAEEEACTAETVVNNYSMGTVLFVGETPIAVVTYVNGNNSHLTDPDSTDVAGIVVSYYTTDDTALAYAMINIVRALDPALDIESAGEVVTNIIANSPYIYDCNGIVYMVLSYQGQIMMSVGVQTVA